MPELTTAFALSASCNYASSVSRARKSCLMIISSVVADEENEE